MPTARKQRSDAILKTQPAAVQEEIFELCRAQSYEAVRKAVRQRWQLQVGTSALHAFYRWYPTSRRLEQAAETAEQVANTLRELGGVDAIDDERITKAAQAVFEAQALKAGDAETFIGLAKLRLAREAGERDARRIALLEKKAAQADEAAAVTNDQTLSDEEKASRMRQIFRM